MVQHDYVINDATGVTRDGSNIQETLKSFFEDDIETGSYSRSHEVSLEEYDDQGSKALAVIVDGKEVGSIKGDDVEDVSALVTRASSYTASFGVNGHDIEDYEKIIDRYKDKKFWKEEDPDFDDKAVNKAYNDLMNGLKEEKVYQAMLKFAVEDEKDEISDEALETMTAEEKKQQEDMERFVKYFRWMFPMSIVLILIGLLYLIKLSTIMGILNLFFGALGLYFSWKYTKQKTSVKNKFKKK